MIKIKFEHYIKPKDDDGERDVRIKGRSQTKMWQYTQDEEWHKVHLFENKWQNNLVSKPLMGACNEITAFSLRS